MFPESYSTFKRLSIYQLCYVSWRRDVGQRESIRSREKGPPVWINCPKVKVVTPEALACGGGQLLKGCQNKDGGPRFGHRSCLVLGKGLFDGTQIGLSSKTYSQG